MKPFKILLAAMAAIALILSVLSPSVLAAQATQSSRIQSDYKTVSIKTRDSSMAIPVDVVLYQLRQKQTITLVDVRSPKDFERFNVPGSLNFPLFAVKTKSFLRSSSIVLVNDGFHYNPLESEVRMLRDLGINVHILDGGLAAWKREGGRLAGDLFALDEMQTIAPHVLFQEKDYANNLLIDISPVPTEAAKALLPHSIHLPFLDDHRKWDRELKQIIKSNKTEPFLSILIFNETGNGYDRFDKVLARRGFYIFFLEGGVAGYKQYLEDQTLSWQPRDSRIKTSRPCRICIGEIQENAITGVRK